MEWKIFNIGLLDSILLLYGNCGPRCLFSFIWGPKNIFSCSCGPWVDLRPLNLNRFKWNIFHLIDIWIFRFWFSTETTFHFWTGTSSGSFTTVRSSRSSTCPTTKFRFLHSSRWNAIWFDTNGGYKDDTIKHFSIIFMCFLREFKHLWSLLTISRIGLLSGNVPCPLICLWLNWVLFHWGTKSSRFSFKRSLHYIHYYAFSVNRR